MDYISNETKEKESKDVVNVETIEPGGLNETPDFYRSLTSNMTVGRLRGLNVKSNLPFIVEFLEARAFSATIRIDFQQRYSEIPLVLGLISKSELGQAVVQPILPDNSWLFVDISGVTIGKVGGNELAPGDKVKLRVYNLKMT